MLKKIYMFLLVIMCFIIYSNISFAELVARDGIKIMRTLVVNSNTETLSNNKTLTITDRPVQKLDPGGSSRDVTLPLESNSNGLLFLIYNNSDTPGENIAVKNQATTTINTIYYSSGNWFFCDGVSWKSISTNASTSTVVDSTDSTSYILIVDAATGSLVLKTDGSLLYNAETGVITANGLLVPASSNGPQISTFKEDSDNGSDAVGIAAAADVTNSLVFIMPSTADPSGQAILWQTPASVTFSDNEARDASTGVFLIQYQ